MFKINGIVGYLLSMYFERITFEEHVYYWLEALHLRFSVLGFYRDSIIQRVVIMWNIAKKQTKVYSNLEDF
jgi:hypothetical protein